MVARRRVNWTFRRARTPGGLTANAGTAMNAQTGLSRRDAMLSLATASGLGLLGGAAWAKAGPASAIRVGDGAIQGSRLKPYDNAWVYSVRQKDGRVEERGVWSDQLRLRQTEGRTACVRVQGMTYPRGLSSANVNVFDPETIAPISSLQRTPDGRTISRTFAGKHVQTRLKIVTGSPQPVSEVEKVTEAEMPVEVYDFNGGMYGTLLAAQQLETGLSRQLPAIGEFTDDYEPVTFVVRGREAVNAGYLGRTEAWVVEVTEPPAMTFWISDQAPYVLRLTVDDGKTLSAWEMIGRAAGG